MSARLSLFAVLALLAWTTVAGCQCGPVAPPPPNTPVGRITTAAVDGGFEIRLSNLTQPVRALQVDVKLTGANATEAVAAGNNDIIEAALAVAKPDFTVVVSDTRRLNLPSGAVVRVTTDAAPASITLSHAVAVDSTGARRDVTVVVP